VANLLEGLRTELVRRGMKPHHIGRLGKRQVEFLSYPWLAGKEIFVLVSVPNKPETATCVGADEVKPAGQSS
jgi:hypothetical protein